MRRTSIFLASYRIEPACLLYTHTYPSLFKPTTIPSQFIVLPRPCLRILGLLSPSALLSSVRMGPLMPEFAQQSTFPFWQDVTWKCNMAWRQFKVSKPRIFHENGFHSILLVVFYSIHFWWDNGRKNIPHNQCFGPSSFLSISNPQ